VTGAAGFIGANLARRLMQEGHEVHLALHHGCDAWRIRDLKSQVSWHGLDLRDAAAVCRTIAELSPDWVFHLAAHGAYSWQVDTSAIMETNLMGTIHLVDACHAAGVEALVNTGSSSEYGWKDYAPVEDEWLEPNSSYAISKAAATHYCRHIAQSSDMRICTLRLYSVYGAFEEPNRLMPALLINAQQGGYPPLVRPTIARDYVYIDDVLDAYLLAVSSPTSPRGAVYNVGTGRQTTLAQVVEAVRQLFDLKRPPIWATMPDRGWDTDTWVANSQRIQTELDWRPKTSLTAGLRQFREWITQPHWLSYYCQCLELRRSA
jgi:UDP-glucose 4-epimerase